MIHTYGYHKLAADEDVSPSTQGALAGAGVAGVAGAMQAKGINKAIEGQDKGKVSEKSKKKITRAKNNIRRQKITSDTITEHDAIKKPSLIKGNIKRAFGRGHRRRSIANSESKINKILNLASDKKRAYRGKLKSAVGKAAKRAGLAGAFAGAGVAGAAYLEKKKDK